MDSGGSSGSSGDEEKGRRKGEGAFITLLPYKLAVTIDVAKYNALLSLARTAFNATAKTRLPGGSSSSLSSLSLSSADKADKWPSVCPYVCPFVPPSVPFMCRNTLLTKSIKASGCASPRTWPNITTNPSPTLPRSTLDSFFV
jgi:hypothetical protein